MAKTKKDTITNNMTNKSSESKKRPADSSSSVAAQRMVIPEMNLSANFQEDIDSWVKSFNARLTATENLKPQIMDTIQNTDFNYELIKEQQKEIESLKVEIKKLQNLMAVALKSRALKDISLD